MAPISVYLIITAWKRDYFLEAILSSGENKRLAFSWKATEPNIRQFLDQAEKLAPIKIRR
jgi:hypothetical protein